MSNRAPLFAVLGQSRDREAPDTLSASAQFALLPAEAGCGTCKRIAVLIIGRYCVTITR